MQEGLTAGSIFGYGDSPLIPFGGSWEAGGSASFALSVDGDSVIVYCRFPFLFFCGLRMLNSFSQKRIREGATLKVEATSPML